MFKKVRLDRNYHCLGNNLYIVSISFVNDTQDIGIVEGRSTLSYKDALRRARASLRYLSKYDRVDKVLPYMFMLASSAP